ncbi:unnamed protein product, partial [Owenia fusiformis]
HRMAKDYNITLTNGKVKRNRLRNAIIAVVLAIIAVAIVITLIVVSLQQQTDPAFDSAGDPLKYFKLDDAMKVTWYHGANSKAQIQEALAGNYKMIEGDIVYRYQGLTNQTSELIMAHPPNIDSDLTLSEWLNDILNRNDKAPKLDFKNEEVVAPSLQMLKAKGKKVSQPVWVNADLVKGPGGDAPNFNAARFFTAVNTHFPRVTLSLGWTTSHGYNYTKQHIESLWQLIQNVTQPITFPARASSFKYAWTHFKWLLGKSNGYTITAWTPASAEVSWEGADPYDLLYVRNDCDKKKIYYDLKGPKYVIFQQLAETAGSLFNYLPGLAAERDGVKVTWAHAANSKQQLKNALNSEVMMLEADVLLRGQGTANQTDIPIMAHPPLIDSDNTLEEWLKSVIPSNKGIKLDFKSIEVFEPSLKILNNSKTNLKRPVWINADILAGPNGKAQPVNATEFKRLVLKYFPECTLSIGWTTGYNNSGVNEIYTRGMVQEMADYAKEFKQPITFPIRASLVKASWENLSYLLDQSRSYTLTIWSSKNDNVNSDDMVYVRNNYDIDRIYYDLPEPLLSDFLRKIKK